MINYTAFICVYLGKEMPFPARPLDDVLVLRGEEVASRIMLALLATS